MVIEKETRIKYIVFGCLCNRKQNIKDLLQGKKKTNARRKNILLTRYLMYVCTMMERIYY